MSRPFTQQERNTISSVLAFLHRLLDCFEQLKDHGTNPDRIRELRTVIDELSQMLDSGKIDAESADPAEKARTDGDGIHINVASTFSLRPTLAECGGSGASTGPLLHLRKLASLALNRCMIAGLC